MIKPDRREIVSRDRYAALQMRRTYGVGTAMGLTAWVVAERAAWGGLAGLLAILVAFFAGMLLGAVLMDNFYIERDERQ